MEKVINKQYDLVMLPAKKSNDYPALLMSIGHVEAFNVEREKAYGWDDCPIRTPHSNNHLHVLSDEQILAGDFVFDKGKLHKAVSDGTSIGRIGHGGASLLYFSDDAKKVIASTENLSSRFRDFEMAMLDDANEPFPKVKPKHWNLPKIPESFVEEFTRAYNEGKDVSKVVLECEYIGFIQTPMPKIDKENYISIKIFEEGWKEIVDQWGGWSSAPGALTVKELAKYLDENFEPPKRK